MKIERSVYDYIIYIQPCFVFSVLLAIITKELDPRFRVGLHNKICILSNLCSIMFNLGIYEIYFMIDQQIDPHFVHYSECFYHPFKALSQSR